MRAFSRVLINFAHFLTILALFVATGCTCAEQQRRFGDGAIAADSTPPPRDGNVFTFDAPRQDSGGNPFDPFDPANQCGARTVPTDRVPGTVLIVFDYSSSMGSPVAGTNSTRWDLAAAAVRDALNALPDDMNVGLIRFPTSVCAVSDTPTVAIAPLATSRQAILQAISPSADPPASGNNTPIAEALRRAYAVLDSRTTMEGKGVLLVTDGEQSCPDFNNRSQHISESAAITQSANMYAQRGIQTFVVGLESQSGFLSELAIAGGSSRGNCSRTCAEYSPMPCRCNAYTCSCIDSSRSCNLSTTFCDCERDTDCGDMRRCRGGTCVPNDGNTTCCNYAIGATNFQTDFQRAIEEVSSGFRGECTFEVPRDPNNPFDPALVNVGVTFSGQSRVVVPQTNDPNINGWHYTNSMNETLELTGPICEQLRRSQANVEIVLGCATVIP